MSEANSLILRNPRRNIYRFLGSEEVEVTKKPAPPLQVDEANLKARRAAHVSNSSNTNVSESSTLSYTIPQEVSEAARMVASADHGSQTSDVYDGMVEELIAKFRFKVKDTNRMDQAIRGDSGLIPTTKLFETRRESETTNTTAVNKQGQGATAATLGRRIPGVPEQFWMETIPQRGSSPFSVSKDYKLWRNVKDYGAVGDGTTDDTAAIQKAISDGGRCGSSGSDCSQAATALPVTVYFPSGKYLVSSPIVHYSNTEIIGNPLGVPHIVAASSFVGLGVITSEAFIAEQSAWYLNSNSQMRSARNLVVDLRSAPRNAHVVGIHWQAARGSSLENVRFYMAEQQTEADSNTQIGLYVENGSGGFLADLYFVGGRVGLLAVSQQFAANGLYFSHCGTALQAQWDWGWSLQNIIITDCATGVDIGDSPAVSGSETGRNNTLVGGIGANSSFSEESHNAHHPRARRHHGHTGHHHRRNKLSDKPSDQTPGSFSIADMQVLHTPVAINATLPSDFLTLVLLNSVFKDVTTVVRDASRDQNLLAGGSGITQVPSWGLGVAYEAAEGSSRNMKGETLPVMKRDSNLTFPSSSDSSLSPDQPFFFHRRRPTYAHLDRRQTQILDIKKMGAKGDGVSDDTAIINHVFDMAANLSAVVYIPYGVYVVSDTITVPVGSRIIGQAWPQIVAVGEKFESAEKPHVVMQVGNPGAHGTLQTDVGIVELQGLTITSRGETSGAVLMRWSVREYLQGSVGLWDVHFGVGGAQGTELQSAKCKVGSVSSGSCLGASLMLHMTKNSSAYLENVRFWAADHDLDNPHHARIDVASARGVLIESRGPTWLWGTAAEHNLLYQYSFAGAEKLVAGQFQAEIPPFQASRVASSLVDTLPLPGDPDVDATTDAWGVRISRCKEIQILGAGLSSPATQGQGLHIQHSRNFSVYNINHAGNGQLLPAERRSAADMSSAAALTSLSEVTIAALKGYSLWTLEMLDGVSLPTTCKTVMTQPITCHELTQEWGGEPMAHGTVLDSTLYNEVCDASCGTSLATYIRRVEGACKGWTFESGAAPEMMAKYIQYGYSETCAKDQTTGQYCNSIIDKFSIVKTVEEMPKPELCHPCYTDKLRMMQASPYSTYGASSHFQHTLKVMNQVCGLDAPTDLPKPPEPPVEKPKICVSEKWVTANPGDTCDTIALAHNVSSASLLDANRDLRLLNCTSLVAETSLCLPLSCAIHKLEEGDDCESIAWGSGIKSIQRYNNWIEDDCSNLHSARPLIGSVVCVGPRGGEHTQGRPAPDSEGDSRPSTGGGWGGGPPAVRYSEKVASPPAEASIAHHTTYNCGGWHVAQPGDQCDSLIWENDVSVSLLADMNPSLRTPTRLVDGKAVSEQDPEVCSELLKPGLAYCVSPIHGWNNAVQFPYNNLGCWLSSDPDEMGVLEEPMTGMPWASMTTSECAAQCFARDGRGGWPYAGVVRGRFCLCGDRLSTNSRQADPAECKAIPCPGDASQDYGSERHMIIYSPRDAVAH
ncbi:hypothetical protein RB599_008514 [Gaeumannomyces hyphopodioides]